jgi:hypothetical protein
MASEDEIISKIKGFKEKNSPNFKKYMDFYMERFPEFYNSKLKVFEESEKQDIAKSCFNPGEKIPKDEIFLDNKILTNQPIFNINECKKEINNHTTNGFNHNSKNDAKISEVKPAAKKSNKKIILIITLIVIIIGAAIGAYFLLI